MAYIWQMEWVRIDAIKFERTQIHFFFKNWDVFTAVVVVVVVA